MITDLLFNLYKILESKGIDMKGVQIDIKLSPENYHKISYLVNQHTTEFAKYHGYEPEKLVNPVHYLVFLGVKFNLMVNHG